jgi:uncharacterized protein (DUF58 family)
MSETTTRAPRWAWRRRLDGWFASRLRASDTLTLQQRNIYIVPTRPGLAFAAMLMVLLVASINDQLSLGYLLTFLLAGSGLSSMHATHSTLRGLTLHLRPVHPTFAGQQAMLDLRITNPGAQRYGIGLRLAGAEHAKDITWTDAAALAQTPARLSFVPLRRGLHHVPHLRAETRFPLGLFRAWTIWRPAAQILVYPCPEPDAPPLPVWSAQSDGQGRAQASSSGEFDGVRAYQRGDPLKLVVWKKAAQAMQSGGELVSRESSASVSTRLWLDYAQCAGIDPEARLSRLTAWLLRAQQFGTDYGLRLPGIELAPAQGELHQRECLRALSLWQLPQER